MTETPARPRTNSLVTYRVGGREYPMKHAPGCKVCQSPYRFEIEEGLVTGRAYKKILDSLHEDEQSDDLTVRNIRDHYYNGHLPLEQAGIRTIVETRAAELGKSIETEVDSLIDGITLARTVVQKTFEALADNTIQVELKDGLAAAKFLAEMGDYDEGGADMMAVTEAFMTYHEVAEEFMEPEQFAAFGKALATNPVLKALAAKYDGETVAGEVLDAEQAASSALAGKLDSGED